ncbi:MAG: TerB family tellurite resistance protein, partial [Candidatus Hodarchaeota archaeon]
SRIPTGFKHLVAMLCEMAKGDGKITKEEIDVIDSFFIDVLELSPNERQQSIDTFKKVKESDIPFEVYAREFYKLHSDNEKLLEGVVGLLIDIAYADGELSSEEAILLNQVIEIFGVGASDYEERKTAQEQQAKSKNNRQDAYYAKILGLDGNITPENVKSAYRKLAAQYHPDKVSHLGSRIRKVAEVEMKKINEAYEFLSQKIQSSGPILYEKGHTASDSYSLLKCPNCLTLNRVPKQHKKAIIRCGKCGFKFNNQSESENKNKTNEKILCGDDTCNGIIAPDGRCYRCGKTLEEGQNYAKFNKINRWYHNIGFGPALLVFLLLFIGFQIIAEIGFKTPLHIPPETQNKERIIKENPQIESRIFKANPPCYKPIRTSLATDDYFSKKYFNENPCTKNLIQQTQSNLNEMGFNVGTADGLIGPKTLLALKSFFKHFELKPYDGYEKILSDLTAFHSDIAKAHSDWLQLYANRELSIWMDTQPARFKEKIMNILAYPKTSQIVLIINLFKFDRDKPAEKQLPYNGIITKKYQQGVAPFRIVTRYPERHNFIKLCDYRTKDAILTAFIRGGTELSINVPLGTYELKWATGKAWFGDSYLFGPETTYSMADDKFNFVQMGDMIRGYTVELYLQSDGNLKSRQVSAFDF